MSTATIAGPAFEIASDRAIIGLGNSERKQVGELWASTLNSYGVYRYIDVVPLNKLAAMVGRRALRKELLRSTFWGHSAAITRVPAALQAITINPPEPVGLKELFERANDVVKEPVRKEIGCHQTGILDLCGAGIELLRSPISSAVTPLTIARGYSTVRELSSRAEDFPAGRAIVHSSGDAMGFADLADMDFAAANGVTTVMIPDHYHCEVLFAPAYTLRQLEGVILPQMQR